MTKMKGKKIAILSILTCCPLIFSKVSAAKGEYREDPGKVANGTIIIGEHMIYLQKMTKQLKDIATKSAEKIDADGNSQDKIYYKSEVLQEEKIDNNAKQTNGTWYNITSLKSIEDISTEGNPVTNETISALNLSYHTKEDGITYDLNTGKAVDIYNINSSYNPSVIPELENLKQKLETLNSLDDKKGEKDEAQIESLKKVLADVDKTEEMKKYGENLDKLNELYNYMNKNNATNSEISSLDEIRESENAKREMLILNTIEERLTEQIKFTNGVVIVKEKIKVIDENGEEQEQEKEEEKSTGETYTELKEEYVTSNTKIKKLIEDYEGKVLIDSSSIFEKTKYQKAQKVVEQTSKGNYEDAFKTVKKMVNIHEIKKNQITDKEGALEEISEMQSSVLNSYSEMLTAGGSDEYKQAKNANQDEKILNSKWKEFMSQVEEKSNELITLMGTKIEILDVNEEKIKYLEEMETQIVNIKGKIPAKDLNNLIEELSNNADTTIDWIITKISELKAKMNGGTEQEQLKAKMDILRQEYQNALDSNDEAKAMQIKQKMDDLAKEAFGKERNALDKIAKNKNRENALNKEKEQKKKEISDDKEKIKKKKEENEQLKNKIKSKKQGENSEKEDEEKIKSNEKEIEEATKKVEENEKDVKNIDEELESNKKESKDLLNSISEGKARTMGDLNTKKETVKDIIKNSTVNSDLREAEKTVDEIADSATEIGVNISESALNEIANTIEEKVATSDSYSSKLDDIYEKIKGIQESGIGKTVENEKNKAEIEQSIESVLNKKDNLTNEEKQILKIISLSAAEEKTGDKVYEELYNKEVKDAISSNNLYIVKAIEQTYNGNNETCLPVNSVSKLANLKYAWSEDEKITYLYNSKNIYRFENKSDIARVNALADKSKKTEYEEEKMKVPAKFSATNSMMYISSDYALSTFGIDTVNLPSSKYAVIYNQSNENINKEILTALKIS